MLKDLPVTESILSSVILVIPFDFIITISVKENKKQF